MNVHRMHHTRLPENVAAASPRPPTLRGPCAATAARPMSTKELIHG
jgi:hypothetical protein